MNDLVHYQFGKNQKHNTWNAENRGELDELQKTIHQDVVASGFWDNNPPVSEKLLLVHCEISEAVEELRSEHALSFYYVTDKNGNQKPEGFFVEVADAIIRGLDIFEKHGVSAMSVIQEKLEYNRTRGYRHGGKTL